MAQTTTDWSFTTTTNEVSWKVDDHPAALAVGITICCIGWIVCVPIMTYYFQRFYRQRANVMIHKRYAICTLVIYIIVMIDIIIERPLWILLEVGAFDFDEKGFKVINWITVIFYSFVYFGFTVALLWKFWLLFYDINYSKESQNGEWKNLIAPKPSSNKVTKKQILKYQWFLTHTNWGNFRWITIRMTLIFAILTIISYVLWIVGYIIVIYWPWDEGNYDWLRAAQSYDFTVNMLMLIALIIISYHIPVFYDHFYVREELRLIFWSAIIYYGSVIIFFIMSIAESDVHIIATVFTLIHGFFGTISQFVIVMVQTAWVLRKIAPYLHLQSRLLHKSKSKLVMTDLNKAAKDLDEEKYTEQAIKANQDLRSNPSAESLHETNSDYTKLEPDFTVNDLLEHSVGFDAFMMHLIKEFSMECLLSYVEFVQFLDFVCSKREDVENDEAVYLPKFPSSVPYSDIIGLNEIITSSNNAYHHHENERESQTVKSIKLAAANLMKKKVTSISAESADENDNNYKLKVDFQILSIGSSLYFKYVRQGSDLEINISGPLRKAFIAAFENNKWKKNENGDDNEDSIVDVEKILTLYSKATREMYKLLNFSFGRFKVKQDYERLKKRCMSDIDRSTQKSRDTLRSLSETDM